MSGETELDLGADERMRTELARYKDALIEILTHEPKTEEACALCNIAGDALMRKASA